MSQQRSIRRILFEVVETLVLTVAIFVGIQVFVAQPYKVEGGSMEQTLLRDEYVLIDKLTPRWAPYARGDVVVLDPPTGASITPRRPVYQAGDRPAARPHPAQGWTRVR